MSKTAGSSAPLGITRWLSGRWASSSMVALLGVVAAAGLVVSAKWIFDGSEADTFRRRFAELSLQLALIVVLGSLIKLLIDAHTEHRAALERDHLKRVEILRRMRGQHVKVAYAQTLILAHRTGRTYTEQLRALMLVRMCKSGEYSHDEDDASPYYTPEGAVAGQSSVLSMAIDDAAVYGWMEAPFHALDILDQGVVKAELASGCIYTALWADSTGGHVKITSPHTFPGNGTKTTFSSAGGEIPDPLTGCPRAWRAEDAQPGMPILMTLGKKPDHPTASLKRGSKKQRVCVVTEASYMNKNADDQATGRYSLRLRHTVLVIPLTFMSAGKYTAKVTSGGHVTKTTFTES